MIKLPSTCTVEYYPEFLSAKEANMLFEDILYKHKIDQYNKVPCLEGFSYTPHSKIMFLDEDLIANEDFHQFVSPKFFKWSSPMKALKEKVEAFTGYIFQTCVCIYYKDGSVGCAYHKDLVAFGSTSFIPSISLGEERKFLLKEDATGEEFGGTLKNGSMIIMGENCQELYQHAVPVDPKYTKARINLTFRPYKSLQKRNGDTT